MAIDAMNESDAQLLRLIQIRVPLARRPWRQVAAELGASEDDVIDRVTANRAAGIIREISGVFDAAALGYTQSLVAFSLPDDLLAAAGATAAGHPGVGHCYARDDSRYNLWFTLAVSPESSLGLEATVERLAGTSKADSYMVLPATRRFKLAMPVDFQACSPLTWAPSPAVAAPTPTPPAAKLTKLHRRAVVALQTDLPATPDAFAAVAELHSLDADDLLVAAADLLAAGVLRRYAAVPYHRAAGATANVMTVWQVPQPQTRHELAGTVAAAHPAVSHCYLRPTGPDWPYELYTMIHGQDRRQCVRTIEQIAAAIGIAEKTHRRELWTRHEYKKTRVKFFTDEEANWEAAST
jgi:DNA-binding Lrp family transcriptional regulator